MPWHLKEEADELEREGRLDEPVLQTIVQAVNQTLRDEMRRNGNMVILGEDIGRDGGVFRATEGLLDEFGAERVIDTPLAEDGIVGMAIGMALYGLQPVAGDPVPGLHLPAFNQIVSELAKIRYRSGGQFPAHVVIRTPYGGGVKGGLYHSQSTEAYFIHTPGLVVARAVDALRHEGPAPLCDEVAGPGDLPRAEADLQDGEGGGPRRGVSIPIGKAKVVKEGTDVTLVSWGAMVQTCKEAVAARREGEHERGAHRPEDADALRHRDGRPVGEEDGQAGHSARGDEDLRASGRRYRRR